MGGKLWGPGPHNLPPLKKKQGVISESHWPGHGLRPPPARRDPKTNPAAPLAPSATWRANNQEISPLPDVRNYDMELSPFFLVRCVLDCGYPLSSAEGGAFRLGVAQPRAAQRRRGGRRGGERPRPSDFCAVAGRERASGPTRRAKWAQKRFALGSWGQRDLVKPSR
jgi:hypothetical protein